MDVDLIGAVREAHTEIGEQVTGGGAGDGASEGVQPEAASPEGGDAAAAAETAPEGAGQGTDGQGASTEGQAAEGTSEGGQPAAVSPEGGDAAAAELAALKAQLAERDQQLQALSEIQQFSQALEQDPQLAQAVTSAVAEYARGRGAGQAPASTSSPGASEVRLLEPPERGWTEEEAALAEYANSLARQNQAVLQRLAQVEQITGTQLQTQFATRVEEVSSQTAARFKELTGEDPAGFEASLKRTLATAGQRGADLKDVAERELRYHAFGKVKPAAPTPAPTEEAKRLEQRMQGAIRTAGGSAPAAAAAAPAGAPAAEPPTARQQARSTIVGTVKDFLRRASAA